MFRGIGDRRCTSSTYKNTAIIASARGDHGGSTALLREAVRLRFELGDVAGLSECFVELAANLAAQDRAQDALLMLAAAQECRAECGTEPSADEIAAAERARALIRDPRQRKSENAAGSAGTISTELAVEFVRAL